MVIKAHLFYSYNLYYGNLSFDFSMQILVVHNSTYPWGLKLKAAVYLINLKEINFILSYSYYPCMCVRVFAGPLQEELILLMMCCLSSFNNYFKNNMFKFYLRDHGHNEVGELKKNSFSYYRILMEQWYCGFSEFVLS